MNAPLELTSMDHKSIFDLINERADTSPDKLFLFDPTNNNSLTYSELFQKVQAVAALIDSKGIEPGETVAYAMSNSLDTAVTILGILYGGYLATAINLVAGNSVIEYVLEHSEAKLIFTNDAGHVAIKDPVSNLPNISVIPVSENNFLEHKPSARHSSNADTGGLLMYTSGTTGRPKGVVLSQGNLLAGGANTAIAHQLSQADCGMCVLPLYHINGLCVTLMGSLVSGGTLVIPPKFSVSTFWNDIISANCSWFSVVPTQISYLLHDKAGVPDRAKLAKVRFGRSASAPLSPDVQSAFENTFDIPIIETMGLTETAAQILSNPLPPGIRKIGSPGIAYGNEIRIGDQTQNKLPSGEEGEVLVRGPNVMQYYLKNEDATQEALTQDGWLRTGDLGRMDADGYVFITGRLKELIIKGGENIAPREIDEALYTHPDVVEAAAFAKKCDNYGERVEAAVMLSESSSVIEADLIKLCHEKLGAFKCPDRIYVMSELPKGPSGKIQRIKLAEAYR